MRALFVEPFASLSHLALYHSLRELFGEWDWRLETLPDRQWKWRNRVGALQIADRISASDTFDVAICGSLLNLTELIGLRPNLADARRVVYFHENQFAYPFRTGLTDDIKQIMYTNITTALAADRVLFNSEYNRETFLDGAGTFLRGIPVELAVDRALDSLRQRSSVFPIPVQALSEVTRPRNNPPLVLWNHRWEHDKRPGAFFAALETLAGEGLDFRLAVAGEQFDEAPEVFERAQAVFAERIESFGFLESRSEYDSLLARADIVVSSAIQEFYGIAVIEAVACGALPLIPDALSYRELFPSEYRYPVEREQSLTKALRRRIRQGLDNNLPPRAEIARLAEPYLLRSDPAGWRDRFPTACGLTSQV